MTQRLANLFVRLLDWPLPRDCLGCAAMLPTVDQWCPSCLRALESSSPTRVGDLVAIVPYCHEGPVRDAVHRLKYEARPDLAARLVAAAFSAEKPLILESDATLAPVPLHPQRLVDRGYNQSALLARALGRRWRLAVAYGVLHKVVHTEPQVGKGRKERVGNVRGVFRVGTMRQAQRPIWLVDDVVTTGATLAACRVALEAVGFEVAGVLALARARRDLGGASDGALPDSTAVFRPLQGHLP